MNFASPKLCKMLMLCKCEYLQSITYGDQKGSRIRYRKQHSFLKSLDVILYFVCDDCISLAGRSTWNTKAHNLNVPINPRFAAHPNHIKRRMVGH